MKRHVLICGLIGGILITVLKWSEYQFLVVEHPIEIYGGLIAATLPFLASEKAKASGASPATIQAQLQQLTKYKEMYENPFFNEP